MTRMLLMISKNTPTVLLIFDLGRVVINPAGEQSGYEKNNNKVQPAHGTWEVPSQRNLFPRLFIPMVLHARNFVSDILMVQGPKVK